MAEQRTKEIRAASELILLEMLNDITLSTTIAAHREIKRGRAVCGTCGKRCRSTDPLPIYPNPSNKSTVTALTNSRAPSPMPSASQESTSNSNAAAGPSNTTSASGSAPMLQVPSSTSITGPLRGSSPAPGRSSTPAAVGIRTGGYTVGPEKGTGGSTGIGSGSGRPDAQGNVFFDCLVCGRATASNRYAPHLSSCLGLSGSTRRGASRNAAKARIGAGLGSGSGNGNGNGSERGASPYVVRTPSEAGDSDDGASVSGKKGKKNMGINTNGKRGPSPKKNVAALKKARMNASGTATPTTKPSAPSKLSQPPTNAKPSSSLASGSGPGSVSGQGQGHGRAGSIAGSTYSAHSQQSGRGRSTSETPSFGTGPSASQQSAAGGGGGVTSKGHGHGQVQSQSQSQVEGSKARKTVPIPGKGSVPPPKLVAYEDSDDEWIV